MPPTQPSTLPLCYYSSVNVVGTITVDDELHPLLSRFSWYPSDVRRKSPPKASIPFRTTPEGITLPYSGFFTIQLHRLVFILSQLSPPQRLELLFRSQEKLHSTAKGLQRLKFSNGDPWDCRFDNIIGKITLRQEAYRTHHDLPLMPVAELAPQLSPTGYAQPQTTNNESPPVLPSDILNGTSAVNDLKDLLGGPEADVSEPQDFEEFAEDEAQE